MVLRLGMALVLAVCISAAAPAAETAAVVLRGTDNLDRVSFQVRNHSTTDIECQASIAHWYSAEIGTAPPGRDVLAELWSDPADGAVYLLNAKAERMPVQALFCGVRGRAASTRADILLARRAGAAEPAIALDCVSAEGRLACHGAAR